MHPFSFPHHPISYQCSWQHLLHWNLPVSFYPNTHLSLSPYNNAGLILSTSTDCAPVWNLCCDVNVIFLTLKSDLLTLHLKLPLEGHVSPWFILLASPWHHPSWRSTFQSYLRTWQGSHYAIQFLASGPLNLRLLPMKCPSPYFCLARPAHPSWLNWDITSFLYPMPQSG